MTIYANQAKNIYCSVMQITLLNSRHNSENFDISFAFLRISCYDVLWSQKQSGFFWTPCTLGTFQKKA